jgi:biopolymer transport protein ExbB
MEKTCCFGVSGTVRNRLIRPALAVLPAAVFLLLGPGEVALAPALAQDRQPVAGPGAPNSGGAEIRARTGDDESESTAAGGGRGGAPSGGETDSPARWFGNLSAPVVFVTIVIVAMSFYLIALVVWMALHYRTQVMVPPGLVRDVRDLLDQAKYTEAFHRLLGDSSFLARVLAAGVRKLPAGLPQAQRAAELANEDVTMEMEHRTTYLATVGTLGPMIGLVGTVYGMIMSFRVVAVEDSLPQAGHLAAGISMALYSTLEGIAISIPAIFFYAMFRNRIARLSLAVGMATEPLLEQFAPGVRVAATDLGQGMAPASPAHPHPLAVSAARAAAGAGPLRPALPPIESVQ